MTSILAVEDESIVARQISRWLRTLGYTVPAMAGGAREAITQASELRPDLVPMDINLGGPQDGIQVADVLRRTLSIPVVFLTAYADEETVNRARVSEPLGHLIKPCTDVELRRAVELAVHNPEAALARSARAPCAVRRRA